MLQLRQLDLEFAFARTGALGENIQNQRSTVQDLTVKNFLEVAALRRGKLVVENNRVDVRLAAMLGKFIGFPLADEGRRTGSGHLLQAVADNISTGRNGQFGKFPQRIAGFPPIAGFEFHADEKNSFTSAVPGLYQSFQFSVLTDSPFFYSSYSFVLKYNSTLFKQKKGHFGKKKGEASQRRLALPLSGITACKRQVLTPRTKISNPVLGLRHIASPILFITPRAAFRQHKVVHSIHRHSHLELERA